MNRYFYIDIDGKQKGTFSPDELRQEHVKRDTLVWTQGMEQWKRAEEVEELQFLFSDISGNYPTVQTDQSYPYSQPSAPAETLPPMPKTWLVESILVTILPFVLCGSFLSLLGIIAIVYAAQVESFYHRGDYYASLEASRSAGKWTKIAMWIAIAWILLIVIALALIFGFFGFAGFSTFPGMDNLLNT